MFRARRHDPVLDVSPVLPRYRWPWELIALAVGVAIYLVVVELALDWVTLCN